MATLSYTTISTLLIQNVSSTSSNEHEYTLDSSSVTTFRIDGFKAVIAAVKVVESAVSRGAEAVAAVVAVSMADLRLLKSVRRPRAWKMLPVKPETAVERVATSLEMVLMSEMRVRLAIGAAITADARRKGVRALMKSILDVGVWNWV